MEEAHIERLIEALLFVADGPVAIEHLAAVLRVDADKVETSLDILGQTLAERGLRLVRERAHAQLVSAPDAAPYVQEFLGLDSAGKLSPAALETLAIIAYRKPITRAQVEAIRGVNSDAVIRSLLAKSLITPVGRLEQAGRPVLYATTFEFLQYFGLGSPEELPRLAEADEPDPPTPSPSA